MGSNTNTLDRESLLLLYAADELSAQDKQRVETMLANDPAVRAQLDELMAMQDSVAATIAQADANQPLPAPVLSSVRRVGTAMRQWQVDRLTKPTQSGIRQVRKLGWVYGSAAIAAAAVITIFVLWSRVDDGKQPVMVKMPWEENSLVRQEDASGDVTASEPVAVNTPDPDDYTPGAVSDSERQLTSAEHELVTLDTLTDSVRPTEETVTP